jgi:hypothetical protein
MRFVVVSRRGSMSDFMRCDLDDDGMRQWRAIRVDDRNFDLPRRQGEHAATNRAVDCVAHVGQWELVDRRHFLTREDKSWVAREDPHGSRDEFQNEVV